MTVLHWVIVAAVFLILEIISLGLTSIWFAGGAIVAAIANWLSVPLWGQIILFIAVSLILIFLTRPVAQKYLNRKTVKTNVESLIGEVGIVTAPIDNLHGKGQVKIKGQEWTARSDADDLLIEAETKVVVQRISGVKLIVKPVE